VILIDSSAWIEFVRATGSPVDSRLTSLIREGATIASTEPVLMEVIAGARDNVGSVQLRRLLTSFSWIPVDPASDFEGAATIYRSCREAGITPRGLIDCMIAAIALRAGANLLTADGDFARIGSVVPLRLDAASAG
jgi:predicted nucleic acid-binding protein